MKRIITTIAICCAIFQNSTFAAGNADAKDMVEPGSIDIPVIVDPKSGQVLRVLVPNPENNTAATPEMQAEITRQVQALLQSEKLKQEMQAQAAKPMPTVTSQEMDTMQRLAMAEALTAFAQARRDEYKAKERAAGKKAKAAAEKAEAAKPSFKNMAKKGVEKAQALFFKLGEYVVFAGIIVGGVVIVSRSEPVLTWLADKGSGIMVDSGSRIGSMLNRGFDAMVIGASNKFWGFFGYAPAAIVAEAVSAATPSVEILMCPLAENATASWSLWNWLTGSGNAVTAGAIAQEALNLGKQAINNGVPL